MFLKIKAFFPQSFKNYWHLAVAIFSNIWFGFPAKKLIVIGVTGTDGKTTTATILYHILKSAQKRVALISSVAAYIGDKEMDTGFHVTSPDPWELQKLLRNISKKGYEYVVLEVTSHGLDQHRLYGINFSIGILTNITHEHLDYHKTYENYLKAKSKLFEHSKTAIINKADRSYEDIEKMIKPHVKKITYDNNSIEGPIKSAIKKRFPEEYNQFNATAAALAGSQLDINSKAIINAIKSFQGVVGRLEEINNKRGIKIYIDFAHTPNSLETVLGYLRKKVGKGKLISVISCTGGRDVSKRPIMGEIAVTLSDISVFTADDPRFPHLL